jgi:hypothetical protein
MIDHNIIGLYDTLDEAEAAIRQLDEAHFPIRHVSVVAQNLATEREVHGYISAVDVAGQGAGIGAWAGGLFGLLVGAAFVWVPGLGPLLVAGPLAAVLLGGIEGALVGTAGGGLLGWLAGLGIDQQHILKYEDQLQAGKYLLVVRGSAEEVARAQAILRGTGATALDRHPAPGGAAPA